MQEGDPITDSSCFYIIVTGLVEVSHKSSSDETVDDAQRRTVLAELKSGEV